MPLVLDAMPDPWVLRRSVTGAVEAEIPGGFRLFTSDLVPVPLPRDAERWLAAQARFFAGGDVALAPVPFSSARGWPVCAMRGTGDGRRVAIVAYRFWSFVGLALVGAPLEALAADAIAVLASGRPVWEGRSRHLAELWS